MSTIQYSNQLNRSCFFYEEMKHTVNIQSLFASMHNVYKIVERTLPPLSVIEFFHTVHHLFIAFRFSSFPRNCIKTISILQTNCPIEQGMNWKKCLHLLCIYVLCIFVVFLHQFSCNLSIFFYPNMEKCSLLHNQFVYVCDDALFELYRSIIKCIFTIVQFHCI